jgi:arylsulfatase A-like enzyme
MLTSLHPVAHGARPDVPLGGDFTTLTESFQAAGYQTAGFTTHALWLNKKLGFAQGFDYFVSKDQPAEGLNRDILFWLRSRRAQEPKTRENPFFLFVHYYDVHSDWKGLPYETGTRFDSKFVSDYAGDFRGCRDGLCASALLLEVHKGNVQLSHDELEWVKALYDGGIAYTDHHVGLLLNQLKELGYFDSSWIVVTGDHGEEFMEHGKVLHTQPYEETARVPLIIKPPFNRSGTTVTNPVGLVDLMPTLLEGAGVELPSGGQGRSLLSVMAEEPTADRAVYFNPLDEPGNVSVRHGDFMLVTRNDFAELELYHNELDPEQKNNIADEHPDVVQKLREMAIRFHQYQLELSQSRDVESVPVSEEELESLRRLGYVVK